MSQACNVNFCDYVVEGSIDDFPVCALHDARQTRQMLEAGMHPGAAFAHGRPIVYNTGELKEEHLDYKESRNGVKAFDHYLIQEIKADGPSCVSPDFDLTVP